MSAFKDIFTSTTKMVILRRGLRSSYILWSFKIFKIFANFWKLSVWNRFQTGEASMKYLFITDNQPSLHLWWKKILLNHKKISQYYDYDCLQKFLLLFTLMFLLIASIIKNSHFCTGIWFIILSRHPRLTLKEFQYLTWTTAKRSAKYLWKKIALIFCEIYLL